MCSNSSNQLPTSTVIPLPPLRSLCNGGPNFFRILAGIKSPAVTPMKLSNGLYRASVLGVANGGGKRLAHLKKNRSHMVCWGHDKGACVERTVMMHPCQRRARPPNGCFLEFRLLPEISIGSWRRKSDVSMHACRCVGSHGQLRTVCLLDGVGVAPGCVLVPLLQVKVAHFCKPSQPRLLLFAVEFAVLFIQCSSSNCLVGRAELPHTVQYPAERDRVWRISAME